MNDDTNSLYWRCDAQDAKPSADYSAWVLPSSEEAGPAANEDKMTMHGRFDPLLVALWIACCVVYGFWAAL